MAETLEQFAERIVMEARAAYMSQAADDVIGKLTGSYITFGKICVIAAMAVAMEEGRALDPLAERERS